MSLEDWPLLSMLTSPLECQRRFGGLANQCAGATYFRGILSRTLSIFLVILHEASKEGKGKRVDYLRVFLYELKMIAATHVAFVAFDFAINPSVYGPVMDKMPPLCFSAVHFKWLNMTH